MLNAQFPQTLKLMGIQEKCSGIVNAHSKMETGNSSQRDEIANDCFLFAAFRNTTIRLSAPDPNWGNTVTTSLTWTPEPLSTFDRGLTWNIPVINIQQVSF